MSVVIEPAAVDAGAKTASRWLTLGAGLRAGVDARKRTLLGIGSLLLPLFLWCMVSYVPFIWHPKILVSEAGGVDYFQPGMLVDKDDFREESVRMRERGLPPPDGLPANPIYLPAPHAVAKAFYTAFTTPPVQKDGPWLHQSLWHSIQIILWGFLVSSAIGVPLGILAGTSATVSRLTEPFIEFFRYLPAPAFGALAVAVLGIYDSPKIAIIVIGTFFQQVLIIANTTRKLDPTILEAARTLGARGTRLLTRVVVPGIIPDLYRDQRILLGWAWTYLIVAELIGASSGITWFITQQARYQHFDNVYAAIMMIGILGFGTDLILARAGRYLFPWDRAAR